MRPVLLIYERVTNKTIFLDENKEDKETKKNDDLLSEVSNLPFIKNAVSSPIKDVNEKNIILPLSKYIFWLVHYLFIDKYKKQTKVNNDKEKHLKRLLIYNNVFSLLNDAVFQINELHKLGQVVDNFSNTVVDISSNFESINDIFNEYISVDQTDLSCMYVDFAFENDVLTQKLKLTNIIKIAEKPKQKGVDLYVIIRDFYFAVDCAHINYLQKYCDNSNYETSSIFYEMSDLLTTWHNEIYSFKKLPKIKEPLEFDKNFDINSNEFKIEPSNISNAGSGLFYFPSKKNKVIQNNKNVGSYLNVSQTHNEIYFDDFIKTLAKNKKNFKDNLALCLEYSVGFESQIEENNKLYNLQNILCPFDIKNNNNEKIKIKVFGNAQYMNDGQGNNNFELRKANNCKFDGKNIITTAIINKGDELLIDYGESYWASQNHNYLKHSVEKITNLTDIKILKKIQDLSSLRTKAILDISFTLK